MRNPRFGRIPQAGLSLKVLEAHAARTITEIRKIYIIFRMQ